MRRQAAQCGDDFASQAGQGECAAELIADEPDLRSTAILARMWQRLTAQIACPMATSRYNPAQLPQSPTIRPELQGGTSSTTAQPGCVAEQRERDNYGDPAPERLQRRSPAMIRTYD